MLKLSIIKNNIPKSLSTSSTLWKNLRKEAIHRNNCKCQFCGIYSEKYMFCEKMNGTKDIDLLENLSITCLPCYVIRNCDSKNYKGKIYIVKSEKNQIEIVKQTYEYFKKYKKIPKPNEIDNTAEIIFKNNPNTINIFFKKDLYKLGLNINDYKGFFTKKSKNLFEKIIT